MSRKEPLPRATEDTEKGAIAVCPQCDQGRAICFPPVCSKECQADWEHEQQKRLRRKHGRRP